LKTSSRRPAPISSELRTLLLWLGPLAFLALFYFLPLGSIFDLSLQRGGEGSIGELVNTLLSAPILSILGFTFGQALLSTLLTLVIIPAVYEIWKRWEMRRAWQHTER